MSIAVRLKKFKDNEARSWSMDFGRLTSEYVYRMWGGVVPFDEIEEVFRVHGEWFRGNGKINIFRHDRIHSYSIFTFYCRAGVL